ncbi:hypothetical protein ROA7450_00635 [Roseovarius albus]|uniref:Uncharacterized protein n=1 Tax=Roseovarius albus TaxID=1247867 RepID=A0A1X6YHF6_9RHOB|nr:hypothetical protein [Roseovarius albus]SLN19653.1 hypothetical protein ROA7450_00635 [Roseovarius albus]
MSGAYQDFDTRLKKLDRKHSRLAHGYSAQVNKDGLIVFRPKRRQMAISLRGVMLLVIGFLCFKGFLVAHIGTTTYENRITALQEGTMVEQAGGYVMQIDPVTKAIAGKLHPFLN